MKSLIDKLCDCNPQLLRELKGRISPLNLSLTGSISLVSQFMLIMFFHQKLLTLKLADSGVDVLHQYCVNIKINYQKFNPGHYRSHIKCLVDGTGHFIVNWNLWWFDIFLWLSCIGLVVLLVAGTYMLISDLANEERRGTLNFLRLAPQPSHNILLGKMLGVPILLYFAAILTAPLHFWAGVATGISPLWILMYDGAVVAGCIFFYSAAMLFGLVNSWMGRIQPWLGTGLVIGLLWFFWGVVRVEPSLFSLDVMNLFNPLFLIPYLISPLANLAKVNGEIFQPSYQFYYYEFFNWFYWPIGKYFVLFFALMLVNFALWIYWIWQGLTRRFYNANIPWLTKVESYVMVVYVETLAIGFSLEQNPLTIFGCRLSSFIEDKPPFLPITTDDLRCLLLGHSLHFVLMINFWLGWLLVTSLSPSRASLIDWAAARYIKTKRSSGWLWQELIFGETSPAHVSIIITFLLITLILTVWIGLWPLSNQGQMVGWGTALIVTVVGAVLTLIWQIIWLSPIKISYKLVVLMVLFGLNMTMVLQVHYLYDKLSSLFYFLGYRDNISNIFPIVLAATIAQLTILAGLSFWLSRQMRIAGESASKALLAAKQ